MDHISSHNASDLPQRCFGRQGHILLNCHFSIIKNSANSYSNSLKVSFLKFALNSRRLIHFLPFVKPSLSESECNLCKTLSVSSPNKHQRRITITLVPPVRAHPHRPWNEAMKHSRTNEPLPVCVNTQLCADAQGLTVRFMRTDVERARS